MGRWHEAYWESTIVSGVPARDRRSGTYRWYEPDLLGPLPLQIGTDLSARLAQVERGVRGLMAGEGGNDLAGLARFLLRSEAIASSRIEGIAPSARQVALAELARDEDVSGFSTQAELVARNMTLVHEASTSLASADVIALDDVLALHQALLADEPRHHGLREVQNWIGVSNQPIDADFVPPAPGLVADLMADLVGYLNGAAHSALVQAAIVHAQFETIHPFTDGNGRVGRALIHTVLMRRGLTQAAVLPISLVLATFREQYVVGLTAYRQDGEAERQAAVEQWLAVFVEAVEQAVEQAERLRREVAELRAEWDARLEAQRDRVGRTRAVRSDSTAAHIVASLPATPVLTAATAQRIHGISAPTAARALGELRDAGILETRKAGPRATAWVATEVLDLVTLAERRLASTRFDTRASPPVRQVAALPEK